MIRVNMILFIGNSMFVIRSSKRKRNLSRWIYTKVVVAPSSSG